MALSDFRDTYSWQEAVELGPELVQLAEQLPGSEDMGLAFRLRQVMIELPGAVAEDLLEADSYTRRLQIARLAAALDIIDKVYPALDTGEVRSKLEKLSDRVSGEHFAEQTPGAKKAYLPGGKVHAGPADHVAKLPAVEPRPAPPPPAEVQVVPEIEHEHAGYEHADHARHDHDQTGYDHPEDTPPPATKVMVTPDAPAAEAPAVAADQQEYHVQPDSVQ